MVCAWGHLDYQVEWLGVPGSGLFRFVSELFQLFRSREIDGE